MIGILHTRDFLEALILDKKIDIKKMIAPAHFIYKSQRLSDILDDFRKDKLHIAVVTDEYGGMLGIVTMEDLLEEIVGDIWDEDEEIERDFTKLKDGRYLVSGDMDLEELFEMLDVTMDEEIESISVGGFISEQLGSIPKKGDQVEYEDVRFTVKRVKNRRIISAVVSKVPQTKS